MTKTTLYYAILGYLLDSYFEVYGGEWQFFHDIADRVHQLVKTDARLNGDDHDITCDTYLKFRDGVYNRYA